MKKYYSFFSIVLVGCLICVNSYSQKMTSKETESLYSQTKKMEIDIYENLIMFNLTADKAFYDKAMALVSGQEETLGKIRKSGTGDEFFWTSIELAETSTSSTKSLYGSEYYVKNVLNDTEKKSKKLKFKDQEYVVSKNVAKEFADLEEAWKLAIKYYGNK